MDPFTYNFDAGGHTHGDNATGVGPDDAQLAGAMKSHIAAQADSAGKRTIDKVSGSYRVIVYEGGWGAPGFAGTRAQVNAWNAAAPGGKKAGDSATTKCP